MQPKDSVDCHIHFFTEDRLIQAKDREVAELDNKSKGRESSAGANTHVIEEGIMEMTQQINAREKRYLLSSEQLGKERWSIYQEDDEPTQNSEKNTTWRKARFDIPPHNALRGP